MKSTSNYIIISAIALFTYACSGNTEPAAETQQAAANTASPAAFQLSDAQQDTVLKNYLQLKDALVLSNAQQAQTAAQQLAGSLKNNDTYTTAYKMTDSIATTTDLAQQRSTFTNLSNQLIELLRKASLAKGSFYVQFCPMANEGNGGYWLAAEEEVRNPYYGDEMLNCGEVKETIK